MKNKIGCVFANNVKDKDSENSIRFGFISGEGLLLEVVSAGNELENSSLAYGYNQSEENWLRMQNARLGFYNALKAVENAGKLQ